jgi:hypothetical protein
MNPSKSTAGMMSDVRIVLSVLWIARLLSGLQGDTYRLSDPVALQSILANNGAVAVTSELLLIMSIIFVVPTFMTFLTLILKYPAVRWVNLAIGLFLAVFDLVFLVLALFQWRSTGYEIVWSTAYFACTTLIVWYAWRWPKQEA